MKDNNVNKNKWKCITTKYLIYTMIYDIKRKSFKYSL